MEALIGLDLALDRRRVRTLFRVMRGDEGPSPREIAAFETRRRHVERRAFDDDARA